MPSAAGAGYRPVPLMFKELEMNIRPLLLGLPLLLTGCSSMSNFSWSSLSPFNWFGSSLEVGAKGVGKLNAGTPMSESRSEERRVGKECRSRWSPYH